ncbi:unnamed protein product [Meloidogyne enterolobii]|uniref:Uncharacterized protein n=1 Tax=Meloidogyne enterolobii TaxID=390850 RepID=A0ACB0ZRM1_MELEN
MNHSNLTSSKVESRSRNHEKNHFRQPQLEVQGSSSSTSITPVKRQRFRFEGNNNGFNNRNCWNSNRNRNNPPNEESQSSLASLHHHQQKRIIYRGQNRSGKHFETLTSNTSPTTTTNIQTRSAELSDLPGYSYDPSSKKYYKILDNVPGQVNLFHLLFN